MPVPQWIKNLRIRRDNITAELAEIDNIAQRAKAGSKPDQEGEGGGTQHTEYRLSLLEELSKINEQLKGASEVIAGEEAADDPEMFSIETVWES